MKIHRSRPAAGYTKVPNAALRDRSLSWKARGILAYLLSHVDEGWTIDADGLALRGPDGRASILAGLKELVAAGYIVRTKRRGERGQWVTDIEIWDAPRTGTNDAAPTVDSPTSENQQSDESTQDETAGRAESRFSDVGFSDVGFSDVGFSDVGKPAAVVPEDQGEKTKEEEHQEDHDGGTLPPNPLRPEPPSESRTEQDQSISAHQDQPQDQVGNHRPRTREDTDPDRWIGRATVPKQSTPPRDKCTHKLSATIRDNGDYACPLCRHESWSTTTTSMFPTVTPTPDPPDGGPLAVVLPLQRRSVS